MSLKMTLKPLRPLERRLLALALLALALGLAYLVLLHWWFVAPQLRLSAAMDELRDTQSRYAAAIAEQPMWQQRLASLGQGEAASHAFLPEDDANAAAAGLMQRAVEVAAASPQGGACEVSQKMPVPNPPAAAGEPYRKVAVSISLRCDVQPLAKLLYTLEQGVPYLFVEDFSVYRNPATLRPGVAAPLEVQFTLAGYIHQPATSANAADSASTNGNSRPSARAAAGAP
jgi:general secretion pathway protein M